MARKTIVPKDPDLFVTKILNGENARLYKAKQIIFSQGEPSNSIFFIQKGKVKLTVLSRRGKEAIVGVLDEKAFFGEQCLAREPIRVMAATAVGDCSILRIEN